MENIKNVYIIIYPSIGEKFSVHASIPVKNDDPEVLVDNVERWIDDNMNENCVEAFTLDPEGERTKTEFNKFVIDNILMFAPIDRNGNRFTIHTNDPIFCVKDYFNPDKIRSNPETSIHVKDLMEMLKDYNPDAKVVICDWSNGRTYEPTIGSDDEDEGTEYCRIGLN